MSVICSRCLSRFARSITGGHTACWNSPSLWPTRSENAPLSSWKRPSRPIFAIGVFTSSKPERGWRVGPVSRFASSGLRAVSGAGVVGRLAGRAGRLLGRLRGLTGLLGLALGGSGRVGQLARRLLDGAGLLARAPGMAGGRAGRPRGTPHVTLGGGHRGLGALGLPLDPGGALVHTGELCLDLPGHLGAPLDRSLRPARGLIHALGVALNGRGGLLDPAAVPRCRFGAR